jgi:hypothetical protein
MQVFFELFACSEKEHCDRAFLHIMSACDLGDGTGIEISLQEDHARFRIERSKEGVKRDPQSRGIA